MCFIGPRTVSVEASLICMLDGTGVNAQFLVDIDLFIHIIEINVICVDFTSTFTSE